MLKHAYLVMVHDYTLVLERLVQLLDNENNTIYIHIDKKTSGVVREKIKGLRQLATNVRGIYFYCKYNVSWGTNSIARTQKYLLTQAIKEGHDYYHILSGADLPIKTSGEIQQFFEENNGKEFIHFGTIQYQQDIQQRYNVYHFFMRQLGRKRDKKFWVTAETYSLAVQRRMHIDRSSKLGFRFYGGADWCSITRAFACYVVKNFRKYQKAFRFSMNSDEAIWQTIVMDSPFHKNLYRQGFNNLQEACMRYIDWEKGSPYVFRKEDFNDLIESKYMFARKFDENVDREIIEKIYFLLGAQNGK